MLASWNYLFSHFIWCMGGKTGGEDQASRVALNIGYLVIQGRNVDYTHIIFDNLALRMSSRGSRFSLAERTAEEDVDSYLYDKEVVPFAPLTSKPSITTSAPIILCFLICCVNCMLVIWVTVVIAEVDDEEDDVDDDIPEGGVDLGNDDDDHDDFFIQQIPHPAAKGISIKDPTSEEERTTQQQNQQSYRGKGKELVEENPSILCKAEGELAMPEVTYALTLFTLDATSSTPSISKPEAPLNLLDISTILQFLPSTIPTPYTIDLPFSPSSSLSSPLCESPPRFLDQPSIAEDVLPWYKHESNDEEESKMMVS
ncbi:hypothetical protein L6452_26219 [Arctium lappa]|uniref:Uncharacterized protein n=1 Tax=Arctium lappa TaxID=4217 RepID=A0ACB9ACN1_ARCLA|nr:hypothetical protein L6452_26219 [Arctium lappa]